MSKTKFAMVLVAACLVGCTDGGNGDDDVPPGDDAPPFTDGVSMLSGHAEAGYVDGPRGTARFANPVNVAYRDGSVYVADFDNGKIRVVDADDGNTRTLIAQENFNRPFAMAFAPDGTLYVTTDCNSASRTQGPMTGSVWRIDNGVATIVAENIGRPRGIAVLPDGTLAISDYQHHVIQLVNPVTGAVTKLAGGWDSKGMVDGAAARFSKPYGLVVVEGQLVVADQDNNRLRLVGMDGTAQTLAGSAAGYADGAMATAQFAMPQGLSVASNGDIYITDTENYRIRRIRDGAVETIAGSGEGGYLDHDDRLAAQVYGLEGLSVNPDGSQVFIADGNRGEDVPYNRIRLVKMQ
jgi:sugar lactone lactonase YvrE